MFLVDDILFFPARGFLTLVQEVRRAAGEEEAKEAGALRALLVELYKLLEGKKLSPEEFDAREKPILDRLDAVEARQTKAPPVAEDSRGRRGENTELPRRRRTLPIARGRHPKEPKNHIKTLKFRRGVILPKGDSISTKAISRAY